MSLGPHMAFIVAAYVSAFAIMAGLVAWVMIDYRLQRRRLAELEASGVTRRSDQTQEA